MYSKVNLGLLLEDQQYFRIIRELVRIRDRGRVTNFKKSMQDVIYCDKCKGFGHTDATGNILNFSIPTLENVGIPASDEIIKDVAYLGKVGISKSPKSILAYKQYLDAIRRDLKNKITDKNNLDKVFKASIKRCDECFGYGVKDVSYTPSFSIAVYNAGIDIAIAHISKSKSKYFNLYETNIGISELYQQFATSSNLMLISKRENKIKSAKETSELQNLQASFIERYNKNLVRGKLKRGKAVKYINAAEALRAQALDEMFARWVLQKLRATIRVDTGLSKRKLKAEIQDIGSTDFKIFIMSARVMDKHPDNADESIYIANYSDWLFNNRREWSDIKAIPSLRKYIHNAISSEFIKVYKLDNIIETGDTEGGDLSKRLMKLIVMFGEAYGGK